MNIILIATPLPDVSGRAVLRCASCKLVQFRRDNPDCPRCRALLFADELALKTSEVAAKLGPMQFHSVASRSVKDMVRANLKRIRVSKGWSQRDAAMRLRVPRTWFSKLENGKTEPTITSLERLAEVYGVHPADLLSDHIEMKRKAAVQRILSDPFLAEIALSMQQLSAQHRLMFVAKLKYLATLQEPVAA